MVDIELWRNFSLDVILVRNSSIMALLKLRCVLGPLLKLYLDKYGVTLVEMCSRSIKLSLKSGFCYPFCKLRSSSTAPEPRVSQYVSLLPFLPRVYIAVKEKYAKFLPHSSGRYQVKRFRKAHCPIVERLVCSLMMHGRNNGKKLLAMRIVKHAFKIIHLLTGEASIELHNPLQVLVNAIINSGPREDYTRIARAGTVRRQAVDVSPLQRVNQTI
ncbi:hypothetical protein KUTeg_022120 [Tegillarca granosa]|uniref:Small ribosomal subunit protein uS7 domain-containing protein n=1 Tax=Tegillarca granosa TaxID=220873 RepID=A0ABQ9E866_TEGGR|nr:hypothetical protein KUTeg_022120 [Tegillarca granosa]